MAFGLIAPAMAEVVPCLSVISPDGDALLVWALTDVAEIELSDNGIAVKSNEAAGESQEVFSYSQIKEIELGDNEPIITGINDSKVETVARVTTDMVQLTNAPAMTGVAIYDMNGREVLRNGTDANGSAFINLSSLSHGAYVIKVNNYTLKFVK